MRGFVDRLPAPPLRASIARTLTGGAAFAGTLGFAAGRATDDSGGHAVVALLVFLVAATCLTLLTAPRHPFDRLGPANLVTVARLAVAAMAAGFLVGPASGEVAWVIVGATVVVASLDGVDGWLARRTHMASAFGARLDMETDAFFILVLSMLVWRHDRAGVWVLLCGGMRYLFVAAGLVLPWLAAPLRSTVRGKAVAVVQFVGLTGALSPVVPAAAAPTVAAVTLAALVWSFAVDVSWLARRARQP